MVVKKPHPLKGRKQSLETIAKRIATLTKKRAAIASGEVMPKRKYKSKKFVDTRTFEQLQRDVTESLHCMNKAVSQIRREIASGQRSLTEVTDFETYVYMAKRYLEGGLK